MPSQHTSFILQHSSHSTASSCLQFRTEEPGRLQSMGLQRVGHNWATKHMQSVISPPFTAVNPAPRIYQVFSQNCGWIKDSIRVSFWLRTDSFLSLVSAQKLTHSRGSLCVLVAQSCPTLCNPIDCTLTGFSVHGILQATRLEWTAVPLTKGFTICLLNCWML